MMTPRKNTESAAQNTPNRKTVLVIEDSPVQRKVLLVALTNAGLRAIPAYNGRAGLEMANEYKVDAIILDVQMPEMDGLVAYRYLRENQWTAKIPVIFLTAYVDAVQQLQNEEDVMVIPKDAFTEKVLLETLRQMKIIGPNNG